MELSLAPRSCDVDPFGTTNFANESVSLDKNGCLLPFTKSCNGFGHPSLVEKTDLLPLNEAPFSLTKMPESFSNDTNPPKNGSHCAALFNDHRNGFKPAALTNGYADYQLTTCNGFHDADANDSRPEKTVGHGRPRQPPRLRSCSYPAPADHDDRFYHETHGVMSPEYLKTSTSFASSDAAVETKNFSFMTVRMENNEDSSKTRVHGVSSQQDFLYQNSRRRSTFPRRQSNGTVDRRQSHCLTYYRNRSFPDFKKEIKLHNRGGMPMAYSENFVGKFESKFRVNGWNHNASRIPDAYLDDEPNVQQAEKIFDVLRNNGPTSSLDIAKLLSPEIKNQLEVNQCLCDLHKKGLVKISNGNRPVWDISEQFVHERPFSPGVIGEERKNESSCARRSHCEEFSERPRRHSYNAYDNNPRKELRIVDSTRPWMRSNGHCSNPGERASSNFCRLCKVPCLSEAQYEEHVRSTKHQNRVAKFNAVPYKKFCEYCKVNLNSESQAKEHFSSGRHEQTVAKSQKAPPKQHLPLITVSEELYPQIGTRTEPYKFQLELYSKAMNTNAVCFLPTGSGNILVAALVIDHMLKLNPSRQVVFLVDRVLLVLQQSDYLRKELAHIRVVDEGGSSSFNGTRPIRIGAVCGEMRKLDGNGRIYEQDVLIITADCYRNHLNNGTLRFDDVSLIVLDEAHHCNKDHPYNVIIRDFFLREDDFLGHRPKVLGLTASPAGELSQDKTTKRLQRLLGNLDNSKLLIVTKNAQELEEKTNKAPPDCISTPYTQSETNLKDVLMEYVTKAFNMAVRLSEMKDYKDIFQPSSGGLFSIDDIHPVLRVIDNIILSRHESNTLSSLLHFQLICEAVCAIQECGEKVALDQMAELTEEGCPHGFYWAETMGLPCRSLWSYLEQYHRKGSPWGSEFDGTASGAEQLVEQLLKENWFGANGCMNGSVLVLVNRRRTAQYLAKYLSNCRALLLRNIRTTWVAGHGGRSADEELAILKKMEVTSQIRDGHFQVVVATSVAEEGLDLPGCQLVVQMNPPSSAQALMQMRGQARLEDPRFVCICRNDDQAKKIDDLLRREENMKRAVKIINGL